METACGRCGAVHGPWGVHAPPGAVSYHAWVEESGALASALTVPPGGDEAASRRRLAARLDAFAAEADATTMSEPAVTLSLGHDPVTSWGPGYGPLNAPRHLHVPLADLLARARADLA